MGVDGRAEFGGDKEGTALVWKGVEEDDRAEGGRVPENEARLRLPLPPPPPIAGTPRIAAVHGVVAAGQRLRLRRLLPQHSREAVDP